MQIVSALLRCGIGGSSIGVISPYRSQLKLIRLKLGVLLGEIEVHTIDKFQGRDKDCIVISLVRSNSTHNVGDLLKEWRRINVAFTRAKRKLILIGSKCTLERGSQLFAALFALLKQHDWIYELATNAHLIYGDDCVPEKTDSIMLSNNRGEGNKDSSNDIVSVDCISKEKVYIGKDNGSSRKRPSGSQQHHQNHKLDFKKHSITKNIIDSIENVQMYRAFV